MSEERVGGFSALSIGIGGMVGGGIFAVTGLTIELTRGAAPLAFVVAGVVALLTAYSYWRLTLRYPSEGGTVEFLNRAFGAGVLTGALNILLCFAYIILLSVYAYALGAYGAQLFPAENQEFWLHTLLSGAVILLAVINYFGAELAIRSENLFNTAKLVLLAAFVVAGLATPIEWDRLAPAQWVGSFDLISGAMVIFLNYEGFELIANAGPNVEHPRRTLPVAYLGGVVLVMVFYVLIAMVVIGHVDFAQVAAHSDSVLSLTANSFLGRPGALLIIVAALLATASAINATFYGAGRLTYRIAKSGELPSELEREIRGQPLEGMILFALLTLIVANFLPLGAIATMGSAGFLLVFFAVNVANVRLSAETKSQRWISALAALACLVALLALTGRSFADPATRWHLWILVGMVGGSFALEFGYRRMTGREIHLRKSARGNEA